MLRALLFDLDGTMVDSDPVHYQTWREVLAQQGVTLDTETYRTRFSGKLNPQLVEEWLPTLPVEKRKGFIEYKEARFRELAATLTALPGLYALLDWAKTRALKTAVVTNAPRSNLEFMLASLDLEGRFDVQVLGEELPVGKPDPLPYRLALEQLGVQPAEAVAFEDSRSGVLSAVAAQIPTVGITSSQDPATLKGWGTELAVPDFQDEQLLAWLARR
ncbi:MAG: HAD family phosphatase [Gemmatimonadaceae bacterium]|nr:HAD family phosphatase [Gloeobacterales cyanobacterium ES-bin-141]